MKKLVIALMFLILSSSTLLSTVNYYGFEDNPNPPLEKAIRKILGIKSGEYITTKALESYGRRLMLEVNLSNAGLTSLVGFPELSQLFRLNLSDNPNLTSLKGLPATFNNLVALNISNTGLTSLVGLPVTLPRLGGLDLSNTSITSLEGLPTVLPNLGNLNVSNTDFASLEGMPVELRNLGMLNLSNTRITSLVGLPKELPALYRCNISNTGLSSLVGLPKKLPRLWELLNLSGNPNLTSLEGLPKELRRLRDFDISNTGLTSLKDFPRELPGLQSLNLSGNPGLTSLAGLPREELPVLRFNLSNTGLTSLVGLPRELYSMQKLDLAGNPGLTSLKGLPRELPALNNLNISKTGITNFAGLPKKPLNLAYLDFSNTHITNFNDLQIQPRTRLRITFNGQTFEGLDRLEEFSTAQLLWTVKVNQLWYVTGSHIASSPLIGDNAIYLPLNAVIDSAPTKMFTYVPRFNLTDGGEIQPPFTVPSVTDITPVEGSDGIIYQGTDLDFSAFNPDGSTKWSSGELSKMSNIRSRELAEEVAVIGEAIEQVALPGVMQYPPIIDEARNRIYVTKGLFKRKIIALNKDNGFQVWDTSFDSEVHTSSKLGYSGLIYATDLDGYLHVINPENGETRTCRISNNALQAAPVIGNNGLIYMSGLNQGILYAFDASSEEPFLWQTHVAGTRILLPVAIGDGKVYVVTENKLFAFNAKNGEKLWGVTADDVDHLSMPVFNETVNAVYVAGGNKLLAFSSEGKALGIFTAPEEQVLGSFTKQEGQTFPFAPVFGGSDKRLLCIGSGPKNEGKGAILLHVIKVDAIDGNINISRVGRQI